MKPAYLIGRRGNDGPYSDVVFYKKSEAVAKAREMARNDPSSDFVVLKTVEILKVKSKGESIEKM